MFEPPSAVEREHLITPPALPERHRARNEGMRAMKTTVDLGFDIVMTASHFENIRPIAARPGPALVHGGSDER